MQEIVSLLLFFIMFFLVNIFILCLNSIESIPPKFGSQVLHKKHNRRFNNIENDVTWAVSPYDNDSYIKLEKNIVYVQIGKDKCDTV